MLPTLLLLLGSDFDLNNPRLATEYAHFHRDQLDRMVQNETMLVEWQTSKARANPSWVQSIDKKVEAKTRARWAWLLREELRGKSVLCVGARGGGEVRAFRSLGAFAVGVDLYPAAGTDLVLPGNAHYLQFASSSADFVFTNIMDHIPDLCQFASEVARVLRPGGLFFSDVLLQTLGQDSWAVRDTGTPAFYAFLADCFNRTRMMELPGSLGHAPSRAAWLRKVASGEKLVGVSQNGTDRVRYRKKSGNGWRG